MKDFIIENLGFKRYEESDLEEVSKDSEVIKALELLSKLGESNRNLYVRVIDTNVFGYIPTYYDGIFLYELKGMFYTDEEKAIEAFAHFKEVSSRAYKDGNFETYSADSSQIYAMVLYYNIFKSGNMNNQQIFEGFITALQKSNFRVEDVSDKIIKKVIESIPENLLRLREVGKEDKIKIYSAIGSRSKKTDDILSWTTKKEIANQLGMERYDNGFYIVKGEVDIKDIIFDFDKEVGVLFDIEDYSDNLKEVIVKPNSVKILNK